MSLPFVELHLISEIAVLNCYKDHTSSKVKSEACFSDSVSDEVIHIIKYISIMKYMLRRVLEDVELTLFET